MPHLGESGGVVRDGIVGVRGVLSEQVTGHGVPSLFPGRQWQQVLARDAKADGQFVYVPAELSQPQADEEKCELLWDGGGGRGGGLSRVQALRAGAGGGATRPAGGDDCCCD